MNTLIDTLSLSMIIISVGILATAVLLPLYVFKSTQNLQDTSWQEQDWKFSDWAGNLTPMGTIIGLVIPFIQKNSDHHWTEPHLYSDSYPTPIYLHKHMVRSS